MARHVKTVNTQPRGKTVGACKHRYRLRWICGDTGRGWQLARAAQVTRKVRNHSYKGVIAELRYPETSFGTCRWSTS